MSSFLFLVYLNYSWSVIRCPFLSYIFFLREVIVLRYYQSNHTYITILKNVSSLNTKKFTSINSKFNINKYLTNVDRYHEIIVMYYARFVWFIGLVDFINQISLSLLQSTYNKYLRWHHFISCYCFQFEKKFDFNYLLLLTITDCLHFSFLVHVSPTRGSS